MRLTFFAISFLGCVLGLGQPPQVPREPKPLTVQGFKPASHVGPERPSLEGNTVTVVLHGNFDRPEWQCDMWNNVAGFYGWILCPRGIPSPGALPSEDRWTYRGSRVVSREIDASLAALKTAYPGQVKNNADAILVGFSLGASLAPNIIIKNPGFYSYLYIIEGGAGKLTNARIAALKRAGIKGIGMAMSTASNRKAAKSAIKRIRKHSLRAVYVNMSGAGHNYRADFDKTGRQSLLELVKK